MNQDILELGYALMQELSQSQPASAARMCKRLGVRMSSLQRCLAYFGEQEVGGQAGLGWVQVMQDDERLMLSLSAAGLAQWQLWQNQDAQDVS